MHVRGIKKKLFLAGVTVALLSSGVAGAKDTALAAEAEESGVVTDVSADGTVLDAADADDANPAASDGDVTDPEGLDESAAEADETDAAAPEDAAGGTAPGDAAGGTAQGNTAGRTAQGDATCGTAQEGSTTVAAQGSNEDTEASDPKKEDASFAGLSNESTDTVRNAAQEAAVSEAAEDATDGWAEENGYKVYYKDGAKVKSQVLMIGGEYYGFNYNGHLYKNSFFTMYNNERKAYTCFHAGSDGVLARSTWYSSPYDTKYYFEADAGGAQGIRTIGGKKYLFDEGMLMVHSATYVEDDAYAGNKNGAPVKLKKNGWTQVDDAYFYCVEGEFKSSAVIEWNGTSYAFFNDGKMVDDSVVSIYDSKESRQKLYCAKKGGALRRQEWYQDPNTGYYYYFKKDYSAATGYTKLGSTYYLFDSYGCLVINKAIQYDGELYVADENGKASKVTKKTGWLNAGEGKYYYVKDGELVKYQVLEIGGKLYGFDYYGQMYKGVDFGIDGNYYCAKKSGVLYRNEWYEDGSSWYYYGDDSLRVTGLKKIGKKYYYFGPYGTMYTNTETTDDTGRLWIVDSKGVAKKTPDNGWLKVNDSYYYFIDGTKQKNKVLQIGEKLYGFSYEGILYMNTRFYDGKGNHRAGKDGALLTGAWFKDEYYDANGNQAAEGITTIKGKKYMFDYYGKLICSAYAVWDDVLYYGNGSGIPSKVKKNGLYRLYDNSIVMLDGGELVKEDWRKVDGDYYYFDSYGEGENRTPTLDGSDYIFLPDGRLARNGWISLYDRVYYAKGSGELLKGAQTIDGKKYYFSSYGVMQTGFMKVDGKLYYYGNDGARIGGERKDGWNKIGGQWYYISDGWVIGNGKQVIDSKTYYFISGKLCTNYVNDSTYEIYGKNGELITGGWVKLNQNWFYVDPEIGTYVRYTNREIDGKNYFFDYYGRLRTGTIQESNYVITTDADGAVKKMEQLKPGWNLVNGEYSYVTKDGNYYYTGWVGNYYVSYGKLQTNTVVDRDYLVDADGKWVKKQGWYSMIPFEILRYTDEIKREGYTLEEVSPKYYVKKSGKIARGEWLKIGGSWYYFGDYGMVATGVFRDGKKVHLMDLSGKWQRTLNDPQDGWYEYLDSWIYIQENDYYNGELKLFGKQYALHPTMITKTVAFDYSWSDGLRYGYYYGKNGASDKTVTGWQKIGKKWYYFLKDGRAVSGWITLGKKRYYIDDSEGMLTGAHAIDRQVYIFDKDGALTKQVVKINGWYQASDGSWYYFENGSLISDYQRAIDGKTYYFTGGKLLTDTIYGDWYIDKNGQIAKNKWYKINGKWFYFDSNGRHVTGTRTIGGKTYHFTNYGALIENN